MYHDQSGCDCFLCRGTFSQLMQLIVNTIQYNITSSDHQQNSIGSSMFQFSGLKLEPLLLLQDKDILQVSAQSYDLSSIILIVRWCVAGILSSQKNNTMRDSKV